MIFRVQNSGGRNISKISVAANEREVTLMAGSTYSVASVTDLPACSGDQRAWYEVLLQGA